MLLSRASEYGVQVMVELCHTPNGEFVAVSDLAKRRNLSPSFLSKVVNQLVEHGLVDSQRGPGGGVRLGHPAEQIRMIDVVEAIDGTSFLTGCVMGLLECRDSAPCPMHSQWKPVRDSILEMFAGRMLSDVAGKLEPRHTKRRRLSRKKIGAVRRRAGGR